MSVTNQAYPEGDGREYRELDRGMSIFHSTMNLTGDVSGGVISAEFRFNRDQARANNIYVAVTRVAVRSDTAAMVGNPILRAQSDGWERFQRTAASITDNRLLAVCQALQSMASTEFAATWYGFVNVGRGITGENQQIQVDMQNVSTMSVDVTLEGIISDHPIAGRWWLGA